MAQYTVGPVECTGEYNDPNIGKYHPFSGKVVLDETVDELTNKSVVSWKFQIYINRDYYASSWTANYNNQVTVIISDEDPSVNPSTKKYVNFYSPNIGTVQMAGCYINNPFTLAQGTVNIEHDDAGQRSIFVRAVFNQPGSFDTVLKHIEPTGTKTLTAIPRKAVISSSPAITLEPTGTTNQTVTWGASVSTFWYKVQYLYGTTILDTSSATQATSYTYAVPASISEYVTDAKKMTLTVALHTYSDEDCLNEVGVDAKSVTVNFSDDFAPSLAYTLAVDNDLIPSANRSLFSGVAIQYTSRLALTFTGTGVHNATISGYACTVDGKAYSGSTVLTDPIQTGGTATITAVVTDSRGFTKTVTITQQVTPYAYPQLLPYGTNSEVQIYRCDQYGVEDDTGANIMIKASSKSSEVLNASVNVNRAVIKTRFSTGSTWSQYATFSDTGDASVMAMIAGYFPDTVAYIFEIHAEDLLGNSSGVVTIIVPIADVPLHLREGGHGVGIGVYADSTPNRLRVAYESFFDKPIHTDVGLALSAVDMGTMTMSDLWDDLKTMAGGIGAVSLSAAYGNMAIGDYTFVFIPYDDENGLIYFSLLDTDTGDLWIVHIINNTICQPFKLTGSR